MSTSTISMAAQAAAFPVKLASPSTIRLLTELAQTGEIPYDLSPSDTEDDDELSDECSDGDCDECTDPDCPCECHDDDSDFDLDDDFESESEESDEPLEDEDDLTEDDEE